MCRDSVISDFKNRVLASLIRLNFNNFFKLGVRATKQILRFWFIDFMLAVPLLSQSETKKIS